MKKINILLASVLLAATNVFAQGTQINGSQIKDDTITNVKINASAGILFTKINFTGINPSIINAENPLTFNTPLSRTGNAISMTVNPVTLGGTGLTTVVAGHIPFGGSSTSLATSANLSFDSGTSTFSLTGIFHVTGNATFDSALNVNGLSYTWPSSYGVANSVLTDTTGSGVLSWLPAAGFVTLQAADPGTPDTGGINVSANAYVGGFMGLSGILVRPNIASVPAAQFWNTSVIGEDFPGTSSSQNAILWSDSTPGYVLDIVQTGSGPANNGALIFTASTDPAARVLTLGGALGDMFVLFADGYAFNLGAFSAQYLATPTGIAVADAATITPTGGLFHITGTGTPIATINLPYVGFSGSITLIADDAGGFTTTTGGNIAVGSTVTQNHTIVMTFDGTSWYPSY